MASTWYEGPQAIIVCEGIPDNGDRCIDVHSSKELAGIVAGWLYKNPHFICCGTCLAALSSCLLDLRCVITSPKATALHCFRLRKKA